MFSLPAFIAPARFDEPEAALAQVRAIYDGSIAHLRDALQRFVDGRGPGAARARLLPLRARAHRHRGARRLAPELRLRRRPRHATRPR